MSLGDSNGHVPRRQRDDEMFRRGMGGCCLLVAALVACLLGIAVLAAAAGMVRLWQQVFS